MKPLLSALGIMPLIICLPLQAGVIIGGTRVIFAGNNKETSLNVSNPEQERPYLIQSWVEGDNGEKAPFLVTPPLFRLDPGQENVLRIVLTRGGQPQDRETLYWLNIKSVPQLEKSNNDANVLHLTVKTRLKLFYRPAALAKGADEAWRQLTFSVRGTTLTAHNPTPYYLNLKQISAGGKPVKATLAALTLAPFARHDYPLPAGPVSPISWSVITDYGSSTPVQQQTIGRP
ncbi:fimbrial assembly protein [Chimaeribacter coloradensis]|uniref:Fimbrial assembly protein n=1 Tax=Chimaeribacter coloradensis TaxID=2060068 RepID=A0A2N5DTF1_9GAMM|nr:molecular chaperone [Chimaeribacter coloradensis]PLR29762.1 fimbrial assembly protein [Chimaeribacter coloradensis]